MDTLSTRAKSPNTAITLDRALRTGAWHGDTPVDLEFPLQWKIAVHWPRTPPPLSDEDISRTLANPTGQPPVRELCKGCKRPLIIVDDVNRPTPAGRIIPPLLKQFAGAGIPRENVTIVIARGSHGEPYPESMLFKVGSEAAASCRVLLHDPYRDTVRIGKTSFGTPLDVNRHVRQADFVVGIGGVYPNNTAGFGGGAKLALGVLNIRSIARLHTRHNGVGWGTVGVENTFRRDLEEIAQMVGLKSLISAQVDADRELIRLRSGDYHLYYDEEVAFAHDAFRAPKPGAADVVIANAFPNDLSLTFVHMKGVSPLHAAAPEASRIVIAACSEGEGFHGVYPVVRKSRLHEQMDRLRRISRMSPVTVGRKVVRKAAQKLSSNESRSNGISRSVVGAKPPRLAQKHPIWLYRTGTHADILPSPVKNIRTVSDWNLILETVRQEQGGRDELNVVIYPCAPLQVLE